MCHTALSFMVRHSAKRRMGKPEYSEYMVVQCFHHNFTGNHHAVSHPADFGVPANPSFQFL